MAKSALFRINVRIGSVQTSRHGQPEQSVLDAIDGIFEKSIDLVRPRLMIRLRGLEQRLQQDVEETYMGAMSFALNNMMGLWSTPKTPRTISFTNTLRSQAGKRVTFAPRSVSWRPLTRRTIQLKAGIGGAGSNGTLGTRARAYFIHTGGLRRELKSKARTLVRSTGLVRVFVKKEGKGHFRRATRSKAEVPLANISIRIMPRIPLRYLRDLSGIASNGTEFEKMLGISATSQEKLEGPAGRHRAMLQPLFSYWSQFHVPQRIAETMESAIFAQKTDLNKVSIGGSTGRSSGGSRRPLSSDDRKLIKG